MSIKALNAAHKAYCDYTNQRCDARGIELACEAYEAAKVAEQPVGLSASTVCPICGKDTPHIHTIDKSLKRAMEALHLARDVIGRAFYQTRRSDLYDGGRMISNEMEQIALLEGLPHIPLKWWEFADAPERESGWQPIETAPKDGSDIIIARWGYVPVIARWHNGFAQEHDFGWYCVGVAGGDFKPNFKEPHWWMPKVQIPTTQIEGGKS